MINIENLTLSYDGKKAVENISFRIEQGDYLAVIGSNGSGKTTLMKGVLGLKKPDSGSITFDGIARNEISYLPQQTAIQKDFPASVFEVVLSGCLPRQKLIAYYGISDKKNALENMARLGIENLKSKPFSELSGGQRQRVLLARALCSGAKLLVLDEPVSGLDPQISSQMYEALASLNKDGLTIVMISHDIRAALKACNKILHMPVSAGFFGKTEDYLLSPAYREAEATNKLCLRH